MKDFLWIDLSHSIGSDTVVYPGDPRLQIEFKRQVERDGYSLSSVCTGMHVGTHVDSPLHFVSKGENIGDLPIERWMGWATKIKIESNSNLVTTASLKNAWDKSDCHHDILLIDTGHSSKFGSMSFYEECPAFERDFHDFLKENRIRLLGLDLPTVMYEGGDNLHAHQDLLGNGVLIVESLNNLDKLNQEVFFMALPLNIRSVEASPVRAVASNI